MPDLAPSITAVRRRPWAGAPPWLREQLWAVGLVLAAAAIRLVLQRFAPEVMAFATFFPAVLAASVIGGWRAGSTAVALSTAIGWLLFLRSSPQSGSATPTNLVLFIVTCALTVGLGDYLRARVAWLRGSLARLRESELRYHALFESMSEGFDLCEAIRDETGKVVDWRVIALNPALQKMIPAPASVAGRRRSEFPPPIRPQWLGSVGEVLATGRTVGFEYQGEESGRWYEVHLNRLSPDRFCQFFIDVTERKRAQAFQAHLFGELNHRIKNNLQIVSALLRMQAGGVGEGAAREHLLKAVGRIQAISDIHGRLEEGGRGGEVEFGQYLRELCERLGQSLLDPSLVTIEVEADSVRLSLDQAVPLGIVVNELVTNAAKYAYPRGEAGVISVSFSLAGDGGVLTVADRGRGLPKGIRSDGLGLKVVRALAAQLRGELVVREGPGAVFELRFGGVPAPAAAEAAEPEPVQA